jgi:hypothetical protein
VGRPSTDLATSSHFMRRDPERRQAGAPHVSGVPRPVFSPEM